MDIYQISAIAFVTGLLIGFFITFMVRKKKKDLLLSKGQFSLYKSLWSALIKTGVRGEDLFSESNKDNLMKFSIALAELKVIILQNKNILKEEDYDELSNTIKSFESYTFDEKLLNQIKVDDKLSDKVIQKTIKIQDKNTYEKVTQRILNEMNEVPPKTKFKQPDPWE